MGIRDKLKKIFYENAKNKNSVKFSNLLINRLGLEEDEDSGFLYWSEFIDKTTNLPINFICNGIRYIKFNSKFEYKAELDSDNIKIFDPYNNISLMIYCLESFMVNYHNIDINNEVMSIATSNSKMNRLGYGFISYFNKEELDGNVYYRDCIKYMDLILKIDDSLHIEYEQLKRLDMKPFDLFDFDNCPKTRTQAINMGLIEDGEL